MAKDYRKSRLTPESMGSLIFQGDTETAMAAEASANEFESMFLGNMPTPQEPDTIQPIKAPVTEVKEETVQSAGTEKVSEKEIKTAVLEPKKEKKEKKTARKPAGEKDTELLVGRRGRKKVFNEERVPVFAKVGKICFDKMTDLRYLEKKQANTYLCDLVAREKEAYEKNPESYVANRRKKAEMLFKADKGADTSMTFKVSKELAEFIDDIIYEIRCSKELFVRSIIDIDYDKKIK